MEQLSPTYDWCHLKSVLIDLLELFIYVKWQGQILVENHMEYLLDIHIDNIYISLFCFDEIGNISHHSK